MLALATVAAAADKPVEVVGVQAELFPSMYNKLNGTDLPCAGDTLAEGIAVKVPGGLTSQLVAQLVREIVLVDERHLEESVSALLQIEKTVVEGAGAAGLAALIQHPERFAGKTVGVVLCGGNIDTRLLANVLLRDLARSGRLARLRIRLQDQPGALFNVARIFDRERVNIIEVYHQRAFSVLPVKNADLWRRLDEARQRHEVKWRWVKGHAGHELNERADQLANRGVEEVRAKR